MATSQKALRLGILLCLCGESLAEETPPGEAVYKRGCFFCHDRGIQISASLGAPRLGDQEAWSTRTGKGVNGLVSSVMNGTSSGFRMPVSYLSEEEIRLAVEYILSRLDRKRSPPLVDVDPEDSTAADKARTGKHPEVRNPCAAKAQ